MPNKNSVSETEPAPQPTVPQPSRTQQARTNSIIEDILAELENRADVLLIDKSVFRELQGYLDTKSLIPEILSAEDPVTVRAAQKGLAELQARLDRVAAIHLSTRKVLRALGRLEISAKAALADVGLINDKTSKPSSEQILILVLPELATAENDWTALGKACQDVEEHLGNAKDIIRIQMKLDENLHWAQRSGA